MCCVAISEGMWHGCSLKQDIIVWPITMLAIILMIAVTVEAKNVMCNNMINALSKVAVKIVRIVRIVFLYADFYKDSNISQV